MNKNKIALLGGASLMLTMLVTAPVLAAVNGKDLSARKNAHEVTEKNERNHGKKGRNEKPEVAGLIASINGSSFILNSGKHGTTTTAITVTTTASTTYEVSDKATTSEALTVGQFAKVEGRLDKAANTIVAGKIELGREKENGKNDKDQNEQGERSEKTGQRRHFGKKPLTKKVIEQKTFEVAK